MESDALVARRFAPEFALDIPRHWLPGDAVVSSYLNAYTVLVPANESFYIRTLKQCMPKVRDPVLRAAATGFIQQEARHGVAHKRYWLNLDAQGYRFRTFERRVELLTFRVIERTLPLSVRVALVSCVEHINAYMAHEFLSQEILANAEPRMRALMEWHFAEEIEHKAVSFDVLQAVSPGYPIRLLGFLLTAPLFYLVLGLGAANFLVQDRLLLRRQTWHQLWLHLGPGHHMLLRSLRHLLRYLAPGFHPDQLDDRHLAAAAIARHEAAQPPMLAPLHATAVAAAPAPRAA